MVFYFEVRGGFTVYMGADKYENEKLIEFGWEEDIWYRSLLLLIFSIKWSGLYEMVDPLMARFHVDDHSSVHVYLRLPRGPLRKQFRETGSLVRR